MTVPFTGASIGLSDFPDNQGKIWYVQKVLEPRC
jgi:hypothetical protein